MQRLLFNINPVVENILSTGTEEDDIAKYTAAAHEAQAAQWSKLN